MAKFEFSKTLEATKLNKRTGSPTNEIRTISYGAVIENLEEDGEYLKFTFLGEGYRIKEDILRSALRPVGASDAVSSASPAAPAARPAAAAASPTPAVEIKLRWTELSSGIRMSRAKVPGGWLLAAPGAGLTFYPDPDHTWNGESLD